MSTAKSDANTVVRTFQNFSTGKMTLTFVTFSDRVTEVMQALEKLLYCHDVTNWIAFGETDQESFRVHLQLTRCLEKRTLPSTPIVVRTTVNFARITDARTFFCTYVLNAVDTLHLASD